MRKIQTLIAGLACMTFSTTYEAQEKPKEWDISIYGFARADYIFDSRQNAHVRELQLNLYPLDKKLDANGEDINATGGSNFLSIVSRLGVKFKGPDVWGAKMNGTLEGDFFGNTNDYIGLLRLRHAFIKMDWPKTSLTMGQTWKPGFVTDVFPGVANFSTGILFNPFGWAGQVRLQQRFTPEFSAEITAYKDREFAGPTVAPGVTNSPSFNSLIPIMNLHLQYKTKTFVAGVQGEYQTLKPVIESGNKVSDQKLTAPSLTAYFKYSDAKMFFKAYAITGQNLNHHVMLGGFASYAGSNGIDYYKASKTNSF